MEVKCFSLNQRLLDQSEKRFLEADLKEFLETAESLSCYVMDLLPTRSSPEGF